MSSHKRMVCPHCSHAIGQTKTDVKVEASANTDTMFYDGLTPELVEEMIERFSRLYGERAATGTPVAVCSQYQVSPIEVMVIALLAMTKFNTKGVESDERE
jgi:hypothetical protein